MKWAINHRAEHVRADEPGVSYSFDLRCPVCRERVFPRSGQFREAHFAHYGGNSSKACDQYHPREGVATGLHASPSKQGRDYNRGAFGAPALLWKDDHTLPTSLYLRLPSTPGGFSSNLRVISRATSQFRGKDLAKPVFAGLRLQVPPGHCETTPNDLAMEMLINEVLANFKLTGNYFKATTEGGVLEHPDAPLELGESYWLVTQVALRDPISTLLQIDERRFDRSWFAYRIDLPLTIANEFNGLKILSAYLEREVIQPRPRVNLVWPTPDRIDPDGTPVFDRSVASIFVRSVAGVPQCVAQEQQGGLQEQPIEGEKVDGDLFVFRFDGKVDEAIIGVQNGLARRLRFDTCTLLQPAGVYLHLNEHSLPVFDLRLGELLVEASAVRVEVPSHRLWRNVKVNGLALRPLPDGNDFVINGQLLSISAGSFGEIFLKRAEKEAADLHWSVCMEGFVTQFAGSHAAHRLSQIHNKYQLLRWACQYDAQALLPKLLSLMSSGVARGVS